MGGGAVDDTGGAALESTLAGETAAAVTGVALTLAAPFGIRRKAAVAVLSDAAIVLMSSDCPF